MNERHVRECTRDASPNDTFIVWSEAGALASFCQVLSAFISHTFYSMIIIQVFFYKF